MPFILKKIGITAGTFVPKFVHEGQSAPIQRILEGYPRVRSNSDSDLMFLRIVSNIIFLQQSITL